MNPASFLFATPEASRQQDFKSIQGKAQQRLHKRYRRLAANGKDYRKIITAVGRELLGFIWAIGTRMESAHHPQPATAA